MSRYINQTLESTAALESIVVEIGKRVEVLSSSRNLLNNASAVAVERPSHTSCGVLSAQKRQNMQVEKVGCYGLIGLISWINVFRLQLMRLFFVQLSTFNADSEFPTGRKKHVDLR